MFYNNIQNIYPSRRSHSLLNPIPFFYLPKIFSIIPSVTEPLVLATQPHARLQLSNPAKCNNDYTACNIHYTKNCMDFDIFGGPVILIDQRLAGISITRKKIKQSTSVILRLYRGTIDLGLNVALFPCHAIRLCI